MSTTSFDTIHGELRDVHGGGNPFNAYIGQEGTGWTRFANTMTSHLGVGVGVGMTVGGIGGALTSGIGAVPGAVFGVQAGLVAGTTTGLATWGLESYRRGGISR